MKKNNNIVNIFVNIIGMDGAIAYSSAARIFQAFAGVFSLFFIANFLTKEEQGFFYTFGSIMGIQVFFELGFSGIMTQYVAHEAAHLTLGPFDRYEGDTKYKSRISYLIKFCLKWYSIIGIAFFIVVNIVGFIFFNKFDGSSGKISWEIPWLLLSFSTSVKLFQSPLSAVLMGLGKVKEIKQIGFYQQLIIPLSQWIMFAMGLKLYVVGISSLLGVIVWMVFIIKSNLLRIFINLLKEKVTDRISYMKEIFPYQWKIALSWISGYLIFQLFNPVLFATEGPVIAGQMGMTIQVINAIQAFSLSWQNTKVPLYSGLISLKHYDKLDRVFNKTLKQMFSVSIAIISIFIITVYIIRKYNIIIVGIFLGDRFIEYIPMLVMIIPVIVNLFVSSWATYLRCHKKEPFLINSIAMGILCTMSTLILGKKYGLYGITFGYAFLNLFVSLPWAYHIYKTKKNEWHE